MIDFFRPFMLPLMILSVLAGIGAMAWLAYLDQWIVLGIGAALLLLAIFALAIALMPVILLAAPAEALYEKGWRAPGLLFGGLALLYVNLLITTWCVAILWYAIARIPAADLIVPTLANPSVPTLMWAYAVAIAPWAYIASKEGRLDSSVTFFFCQLGCLAMGLMVFLGYRSLYELTAVFAGVMALGLIASLVSMGAASLESVPRYFEAEIYLPEASPGE